MSAHDIALLSRVLIRDFPDYYKWLLRARVRVERHQAAEPQWPAGARPVGGRHQDRPHRDRGLLPRELRAAQRHAAHRRGARHAVVQGARRRQRRAAQLRLHVLRNRQGARAPAMSCSSPRCTRAKKKRVTLVPARDIWVTVGRGSAAQLKTSVFPVEPDDMGRVSRPRFQGATVIFPESPPTDVTSAYASRAWSGRRSARPAGSAGRRSARRRQFRRCGLLPEGTPAGAGESRHARGDRSPVDAVRGPSIRTANRDVGPRSNRGRW